MYRLARRLPRVDLHAAGSPPSAAKAKTPQEAAGASAAAPRFEALLATFLASPASKGGAAQGAGDQDWAKTQKDWATLGDLFKHARFAGGYKEPHELQDAFRTFRKCLKITGEDQHE